MTTTQNSTSTTTLARLGGNKTLSISCDFASSPISIPDTKNFQLLTGQAIERWWNSLTRFQRSEFNGRGLNLRISANLPE